MKGGQVAAAGTIGAGAILWHNESSTALFYQAGQVKEASSPQDWIAFGIAKLSFAASAGEQNIDVQYWSSNAGDTTKIKDVRILVIKADAADQYAESLTQDTTTSTSYQTKTTLTFTPATTGDYLVIAAAVRASDANGTAMRALGPAGLAAAAGGGAMVAGFTALMARTREAIDKLDDLGDKAAKIGVSAEYLQEMRYSLEQLGVPVEAVDGALAAFNVTAGKVGLQGDEGAKKIRVAFAALGISLEDVQKSDPAQLLQRVATEMSKVGDTARQAAIAKQLGIEDLLPALREGGDAIAKLREDARRLGIVLDEDLVRNAGRAKNELDTMQRVVDAQLTQALVNATPLVVGFAKAFASVAEWAGHAVDKLNQVEQRATHTLKVEIEDLGLQIEEKKRQIASLRGSGVPFGPKRVRSGAAGPTWRTRVAGTGRRDRRRRRGGAANAGGNRPTAGDHRCPRAAAAREPADRWRWDDQPRWWRRRWWRARRPGRSGRNRHPATGAAPLAGPPTTSNSAISS